MTIAQQIKWDFETNGDLIIQDKNDKTIYYENSDGYMEKSEWDSKGNLIYVEDSDGDWAKYKRDSQGNLIYYEDSDGDWAKYKRDSQGNEIYFEDSDGVIIDNRPKSCENKEIVIEGIKYKLTKV